MAFANKAQLLAVEDVSAYEQIVDIDIELQRSESAILRLLSSLWWQKFLQNNPHITPGNLRSDLLLTSEWANPTIYYALAYNILPKIELATGQNTRERAAVYHNKWEYDFRHLVDFGISYDVAGTTHREIAEEISVDYIRLRK
jgi:hypothetical protein